MTVGFSGFFLFIGSDFCERGEQLAIANEIPEVNRVHEQEGGNIVFGRS